MSPSSLRTYHFSMSSDCIRAWARPCTITGRSSPDSEKSLTFELAKMIDSVWFRSEIDSP
ncbi:hypothetical protein PAYE108092_20840 [Paracoccus yeei]